MGKLKRVSYFFSGLLLLLCGLIMLVMPEDGYQVVLLILELTLLIRGIQKLWYYFSMARHMVGGIRIFYQGLLMLDAGVFALNLNDVPKPYAMLYLIGCIVVSGAIDIAQANETRRQKSTHWKYQMFYGVGKVVISVLCILHFNSGIIITLLYALGLFHSAISNIVTAFRRTAFVAVQ